MAHLEAAVPLGNAAGVALADDVLEGVAAPPLAAVPSAVSFHGVWPGEVVPRADEMHRFDRSVRLTAVC